MGEFPVRRQQQIDLLSDVDRWLNTIKGKVTSGRPPSSISQAFCRLEEAVLSLCKQHSVTRVQDVLTRLGECENTLARSKTWAKEIAHIQPIPLLCPAWFTEANDDSPEFRLAASLASMEGLRSNLESTHAWIDGGNVRVGWNTEDERDVVWSESNPIRSMNAVMARRIVNAVKSEAKTYPGQGKIHARLVDIAGFIEGRVNVERMAYLLWGLILVDWRAVEHRAILESGQSDSELPGAAYGLLKLCFPGSKVRGVEIPIVPEIQRRASMGDGVTATQIAARRLRGCNLSTAVPALYSLRNQMERIAAALLFPLSNWQLDVIANRVLRPNVGESEEMDV
jgi:CRISPR-associated protein Csx17